MKRKPFCCSSFEHATRSGTDNEGYGSLLYTPDFDRITGIWMIGCGLPDISFCPWCGKKVEGSEDEKGL